MRGSCFYLYVRNKKDRLLVCLFYMGVKRLELPCRRRQILSLVRLPISPHAHNFFIYLSVLKCNLLVRRCVYTSRKMIFNHFASWFIASHLQVVHYILLTQNFHSLFRCYFEFRDFVTHSTQNRSAECHTPMFF